MMKGTAFSILLAFSATLLSTNAESASRGPKKTKNSYYKQATSRDCLDHATRGVLAQIEARYGKVKIVKSCVPGARMPSGHVSWHARNKAFDFHVPKGARQGEVAQWLGKVSPGVTISYAGRLAGIIHTDTGSFHKVIYKAKSHEAGERSVATWKAREEYAARRTVPLPLPTEPSQPLESAPWTMTAAFVEPDFELYAEPGNIFQRFILSQDVVVNPWVRTTCNGNKELPKELHLMLRDAASHFRCPVYVNSMYRDAPYNRKVGGARFSQHIQCKAVDFRVSCASPATVRQWVDRRRKTYGVTFTKTYRSHVHADNGVRAAKRYAKHRKPSRYAAAG